MQKCQRAFCAYLLCARCSIGEWTVLAIALPAVAYSVRSVVYGKSAMKTKKLVPRNVAPVQREHCATAAADVVGDDANAIIASMRVIIQMRHSPEIHDASM